MSERSKEHASKACEVKASASSNLASSATKPPKSCTSGALRWCGSRIACHRVRQATRVWRHHQYLWLGWHGSGRQYRRDIPLGADGWIFFTERALENKGEVLQQPYPVVLGGDYLSYGKCDQVTMPNTEAVRFAVGRLLDTGVRTIAVIGASPDMHGWEDVRDQRDGTQSLRIQGYVQAHEERGLTVDWRYVIPLLGWNQHGGVQAAASMLDSLPCPQAVLCLNDAIALGAIHELQRRGLRVPADVQLIGFDNVPESEYSVPALTTIDPHVDDYAKHAVDMLIERIEGYSGPARTYTTDFTVVERASTKLAR